MTPMSVLAVKSVICVLRVQRVRAIINDLTSNSLVNVEETLEHKPLPLR